MNLSHAWLADFVDHGLTPAQLRDLLTSRVATVDAIETLRAELEPFVVARVVECARHPDSDRLSVTRVDAGEGELLEVVCGAPNVAAGKLYPFARTGTMMPGGLRIERRKIRGAVSNGMLCSARELGLGSDHEGILELDVDASPGTRLLDALPSLSDTRIVLDVLPNRPDLLSHLGVAREIAAATGRPLTADRAVRMHLADGADSGPAPRVSQLEGESGGIRVVIEDADGCPRYLGAVIRGVRVGPSPDWLVRRLEAAGARSINNIVDVTNFMLHGFGQPMHAFDASKLAGPAVIVRKARPGEKLVTLDGVERPLDPDMCIIADAERAQALAGVMGGRDSEVTEATTDIFLEVAAFNPRRVRKMRRAISISTDASYRFERGTDAAAAGERLSQAVSLILALAGGKAEPAVDLRAVPLGATTLTLRNARVRQVVGEPFTAGGISALLRSIGFSAEVRPGTEMLTGNEEILVGVPSWRVDVVGEIDLVEEVARLHGYDAVSDELRPFRVGNVPDDPAYAVERRLQDSLAAEGLFEVRPLPFVTGDDVTHARLSNPIAENEAHLRRSILESLARRAEYNLAHMQGNVRMFEVGSVFAPVAAGARPSERRSVGILVMGDRRPAHFSEPKPPRYDLWDAKALAGVAARAAYPEQAVALEPRGAEGSRDGAGGAVLWSILVGGEPRGVVRTVALDAPVWAAAAYGIEIDLGDVGAEPVAPPGQSAHGSASWPPTARHPEFRPLPVTPAAELDLALVVAEELSAGEVERVIRRNGGDLLERVSLFDEFRGGGVPAGSRSLAWRLTFRDPARTLRDKEVEGRTQKILRALEEQLGVRQRTT